MDMLLLSSKWQGTGLGFNLQAGNYLIGGKYNSSTGAEGFLGETEKLDIVAEGTFGGVGVNYSNQFITDEGMFAGKGNIALVGGGVPLGYKNARVNSSIGSLGTSSTFIGPELNAGIGIGIRAKIGFSINYPKYTSFEKSENKALKKSRP